MRFLDAIILMLFFLLFGLSIYLIWFNLPKEPVTYEEFFLNKNSTSKVDKIQFYENMRYRDKTITYSISEFCNADRASNVDKAFSILEQSTILNFRKVSEGEIKIFCSEIAPTPDEERHFIAGEGGPSEIIDTTNYAVIFSGKVSLFRENECKSPNIALHEILHALGFDHNENQKSIMYPITRCDQVLDKYIVDEINRLYDLDSIPDLAIEKVEASKAGIYLNFEITIANYGLQDANSSSLIIFSGNEQVKEFTLGDIDIGTKKILSVENLRMPLKTDPLSFEIRYLGREIDKTNNIVEVKLTKVS